MTTTISTAVAQLVAELRPYRERADALIEEVRAGRREAAANIGAYFAELDERFVDPLTAEYLAIPEAVRAGSVHADTDHQDACWQLIYAFAGAYELTRVRSLALEGNVPHGGETAREHEVAAWAVHYRDWMMAAS